MSQKAVSGCFTSSEKGVFDRYYKRQNKILPLKKASIFRVVQVRIFNIPRSANVMQCATHVCK